MKNRLFSIITIIAVGVSFLYTPHFTLNAFAKDKEEKEPIEYKAPANMTIEGVDVSGMTESQISAVIVENLKKYNNTKFTLKAEETKMDITAKDLHLEPTNDKIAKWVAGYGNKGNLIERYQANCDIEAGKSKDFAVSLTSNVSKTKDYLENNTPDLGSAPINNTVVRENGGFKFVEGKPGVVVDYESSAHKIADFITESWMGDDVQIDLDVIKQEPKGSKEELGAIKDLLGACSTDFSASSNARAANVRNGTSKLDKSVIYPGEEFSVSTNLMPRNAENGYLPAPSYENGTTVDTYGGGVCQISTTLYNAVIRSELEVVKRYPHSMIVSYVKPSMDAAISEGSKDFVFRNNLNYPVYIEGYTSGATLYFNIFGKEERPAGRTVTYESEVLSTTEPGEKFVADPTLPVGRISRTQGSHVGHTAQLWKVVTENGKEVSRKVFNSSSYSPSAAVYSVGTGGSPEAAAAINAAIASQNKAAIEAAAGSWTPEAVAAREHEAQSQPTPAPAPTTPDPAPDPEAQAP